MTHSCFLPHWPPRNPARATPHLLVASEICVRPNMIVQIPRGIHGYYGREEQSFADGAESLPACKRIKVLACHGVQGQFDAAGDTQFVVDGTEVISDSVFGKRKFLANLARA